MILKHVVGTPIAEDEKGRRVFISVTASENYTEAEHEEAVKNMAKMVERYNAFQKLVDALNKIIANPYRELNDYLTATNALQQIQGEGK